jgi:hypothetical protein
MPVAQSLSALHGPGTQDLNSCVWQSGGGGQASPGAQAEPQPEALVTLHVQPFTQSVSLAQLLSAKAERALSAAKPNMPKATSETAVE